MNKLDEALIVCKMAHDMMDQKRKYSNDPYWIHPIAVMELVKTVPHTEEMLCAALLHDVVEDTWLTIDDIQKDFGDTIALMVYGLTDISMPEDGNRAKRKAIDRAHTASSTKEVKTIKLCDLIDNTYSIVEKDKDFARVYLNEKALLLQELHEGDKTLWDRAYKLLQDSELELIRDSLREK